MTAARRNNNKEPSLAKRYFYPNISYFLGIYILIVLIIMLFFPVEASWESVLGAGIVGLSVLAMSLVAGPIGNAKTIENKWLRDAAASSFIIAFGLLIVGTLLALFHIISWQLANFAMIAIIIVDFIGKLVIAKKRES